jgi:hypothetical protein
VLGRYVHGESAWHAHQGQRVVEYQQSLQTVSDPLLGWITMNGLQYYVRQFRNIKGRTLLDAVDAAALADYAGVVGQLLAKGYARTSGASMIAGYMGSSDRVDKALCKFARRYSDQTEATTPRSLPPSTADCCPSSAGSRKVLQRRFVANQGDVLWHFDTAHQRQSLQNPNGEQIVGAEHGVGSFIGWSLPQLFRDCASCELSSAVLMTSRMRPTSCPGRAVHRQSWRAARGTRSSGPDTGCFVRVAISRRMIRRSATVLLTKLSNSFRVHAVNTFAFRRIRAVVSRDLAFIPARPIRHFCS